MLEIALSSFWHWLGAVGLILSMGAALSLPLYWIAFIKEDDFPPTNTIQSG